MQIHAVTECSNLHLNNIAITKVHEFKDLGVIIDEILNLRHILIMPLLKLV